MNPLVSSNQSLMAHGNFWFPELAEKSMGGIDLLYWGVFWVSVVLGTAIFGIAVYFAIKYRKGRGGVEGAEGHSGYAMEIAWTVIPFILVMILFVWGFVDHLKQSVPPKDAYEIRVIAKKWFWQFEYPQEGLSSINDLAVPVGRNIKLLMSSEDVIHSFFLPNFRRKKDVLPNRYTSLWFRADRVGQYQIFCTEYCGDGHSVMLGNLKVLSPEGYKEWVAKSQATSDEPLPLLGKKLYQSKACFTCHTIDGGAGTAPTLKGLYGTTRRFQDGTSAPVDDTYIRESILVPAAKVVVGFPNVMSPYQGLLKERELAGLIEFIKTLK